jgi:hypothetical protein
MILKLGYICGHCSLDSVHDSVVKASKTFILQLHFQNYKYIFNLNSSFFVNRKIEFPLRWPTSVNIQKFKSVGTNNTKEGDLVPSDDENDAVQNSMLEESTLLMKFCSISPDYTRASCDSIEVNLPFELTEEQRSIIVFPRSTFLLGRSGTGKTTVLTTKMIRNEKLHHVAIERVYGPYSTASESSESAVEIKRPVLRQLFVTLSPGLCKEIKHHVSCFKRYASFSTILSLFVCSK